MPAATVGLKAGDHSFMEIDWPGPCRERIIRRLEDASRAGRHELQTEGATSGTEQPLEFDIVRRSIQLPFIPYYAMLDTNIGYINLSTFSGNPSKEFKQAFLDLKKAGNNFFGYRPA